MSWKKYLIGLVTFFLLFTQLETIYSYNDNFGVELNDIVDLSFTQYIDGLFTNQYTPENPFRVKVNTSAIHENFVNELLGMKEGESKSYISWINNSGQKIEFYDLTVVKIVEDSTPETISEPSPTKTIGFLDITSVLSLLIIYSKTKKN